MQFGNLNVGLKYEFKTSATFTNKTELSGISASDPAIAPSLGAFADGAKVPNDIPAFLQIAAGYEFLPTLRATVEYHHFYDRKAAMGLEAKQQYLTGGTDEYLGGIEWDITDRFTLSGGYQKTNYGLADGFQSDLSFSCDSYSIGFGGAIRLNNDLELNLAYFWTTYDDYTKDASPAPTMPNIDTYSRTNKVFGVGLNYSF
jgi:long-chain fatty acid transport protein